MNLVNHDLFNICERIKRIDQRYRVFLNKSRYEVWTDALEFVVPFDVLDARTLEHARRTRTHNLDVLEQEIAQNNLEIEQSAEVAMQRELGKFQDMLAYANGVGHEVRFGKVGKWV